MTRRPLTSTLSPPTPLSRPPPPYRELEPRGGAQLRAGHPAERAPARQPETLRLEQGEDEPAERLGRGHEVATGQHAARRAGPGPRDLQQMVSLKLPRRPLELGPREDSHRVGPLLSEPLHLDAVEPEQSGDVAVRRGEEVAGR